MTAVNRMMSICFAAMFFFILHAIPASSAESSNRPVVHAAVLDFFPFGYRDAGGAVVGLSVDLFRSIAEEAGLELDAHLLPVPRALAATTLGEVDILYSYRDSEMIKGVEFLGNVGCLTSLVVPRAGFDIRTLYDLSSMRIGYINAGYFAIRYVPNYKMVPFPLPSNETMFRMLIRDRLDGIVLNDAVLFAYKHRQHSEAKLPAGWVKSIGRPFILETLETHVSISLKSKLLNKKRRIMEAIEVVRRKGLVAKAYKQYGLPHGGSCDVDTIRDALNRSAT